MKVMVLGGAGFIGPRVMRRILERGHDVACIDVNTNSPTHRAVRDSIQVLRGDITVFDDVAKALMRDQAGPRAQPRVPAGRAVRRRDGRAGPALGVRLNIMGMDNCFEAARIAGHQARRLRQLARRLRTPGRVRRPAADGRRRAARAPACTRSRRSTTSTRQSGTTGLRHADHGHPARRTSQARTRPAVRWTTSSASPSPAAASRSSSPSRTPCACRSTSRTSRRFSCA